MEKPVHTLSFSMSYPQYRDYYLYQISIAKNRPGMVGSGAFFGSRRAGGCGVPAFSQDGSGWFFTGFSIGYRNGFLDMCGCLLYRAAGMVVPNPAQSAPAVPVEAIGKTKIANSPVSRFCYRSLSIGGI